MDRLPSPTQPIGQTRCIDRGHWGVVLAPWALSWELWTGQTKAKLQLCANDATIYNTVSLILLWTGFSSSGITYGNDENLFNVYNGEILLLLYLESHFSNKINQVEIYYVLYCIVFNGEFVSINTPFYNENSLVLWFLPRKAKKNWLVAHIISCVGSVLTCKDRPAAGNTALTHNLLSNFTLVCHVEPALAAEDVIVCRSFSP